MEGKEPFIDFLSELKQDYGMNQKNLSVCINCKSEAIGRWFSKKYFPSPQTLISIALKFNVSIDYMFGLSDTKELNYKQQSTTFYERYCNLRDIRKKNDHQVTLACELGNSTIYDWKNKIEIPHVSTMLTIAHYLECSLDYLFGIGEQ